MTSLPCVQFGCTRLECTVGGNNTQDFMPFYSSANATAANRPVLRKANADGLRWDAERLDRYLVDPAAMFPGLWMAFGGIEDAAERAALVRFIAAPNSR